MTQNQLVSPSDVEDDIDLKELWALLVARWTVIAIVTAFAAMVSLLYGFSLTEIYRSEALLAPAESRQPSNPLLSQFGAAAGLIGINVPENNSQISAAIATLQSRQFIKQFITAHQISPLLLAGEWDASSGATEIDAGLYDTETRVWRNGQPTDEEAFRAFRAVLSVSENPTNGMVTVAIEWYDPKLAQQWVQWLVEDINEVYKKQDQEVAQSAIEYLRDQLSSTQLIEMQNIFYQLIESQMRIVMLADVRDEYVFKVVDPAFVPEEKIRPRKSIIAIVGTLSGFLLAVTFLLLRHYISKQSDYVVRAAQS